MDLAHAGGEVGNGGEVVACRKSDGTLLSVEVLDSFEGRVLNQMSPSLGDSSLSMDAKINLAIATIHDRNPTRAELYTKWKNNFFDGVTFTNEKLEPTPDVDPSILPKGCAIEQIAIQNKNTSKEVFEHGPIVVINKILWDFMSVEQRAILVLHEIIYHEANISPQESAEPIRYFNQLLFSGKISTLDSDDYVIALKAMHLTRFDFAGLDITVTKFDYFLPLNALSMKKQDFVQNGTTLHISENKLLTFSSNRDPIKLGNVFLEGPHKLKTEIGEYYVTGETTFDIEGNDEGNVVASEFAEDSLVYNPDKSSMTCKKGSKFWIKDNSLKFCSMVKEGTVISTYGYNLTVVKEGKVEFFDRKMRNFMHGQDGDAFFKGSLRIGEREIEFEEFIQDHNGNNFSNNILGKLKNTLKLSIGHEGSVASMEGYIGITIDFNQNDYLQTFNVISFHPMEDFIFKYNNNKFAVASTTQCSDGRIIQNEFNVEDSDYAYHFTLAKAWYNPDRLSNHFAKADTISVDFNTSYAVKLREACSIK
jgi:hypothetical protein